MSKLETALARLRDAERERDQARYDAQRLFDGWRAEADRARKTGLTIEAVRDIVNAHLSDETSFSRLVEDLRTLAMVRAEQAEKERDEARAALIRSQEDHRAAVEALETYEERIGDIADHVLGLVPPNVPSIVKLDAIERRCGEERVTARQAERERDEARAALSTVNDIRNSIIGAQTVNWSEHVYPLVAALDAAGFAGMPYPEARENVGTLIERANKAEARVAELEAARDTANALYAEGQARVRELEAKWNSLREAWDDFEWGRLVHALKSHPDIHLLTDFLAEANKAGMSLPEAMAALAVPS